VQRHKEEIFNVYCPRLADRAGYGAITAGVLFPSCEHDSVIEYSKIRGPDPSGSPRRRLYPVAGREPLESGNIDLIFPEHSRRTSRLMDPDLAQDLRNWLTEPDYSSSQRRPLALDNRQRQLVTSRPGSGYRRIRGPAGSGKSLVLAARASELASDGKKVLIVSFNITLLSYLRDLALRWKNGPELLHNTTWLNFHEWCKRVARETGREGEYKDLWRKYLQLEEMGNSDETQPEKAGLLKRDIPELVSEMLGQRGEHAATLYDAIVVDEGQDFQVGWWQCLRKARRDGGEMLLVADATQDIYGTARKWTEQAMQGAGFTGPWVALHRTYRLPPQLIPLVRDFANRFLERDDFVDLPEPDQKELDIFCTSRWVQCAPDSLPDRCVEEILNMAPKADPEVISMADITFLAPDNELGSRVVHLLGEKRIRVTHTFAKDGKESRRLKLAFFRSEPRIKATTLHSFKGWEAKNLVVAVRQARNQRDLCSLYTALTRVKRHEDGSWLTVVCADPRLREYGRTWSE
jgi:hypothetical protein